MTSLWRQPQRYALFLGQELFLVYKGRLLVVMPNGYGVSQGGKAVPELSKAVAGLARPRGGGSQLAVAAEEAVERLAAAGGVTVTRSGGGSATRDRVLIGVAALAALAVVGAAAGIRRRGRAG